MLPKPTSVPLMFAALDIGLKPRGPQLAGPMAAAGVKADTNRATNTEGQEEREQAPAPGGMARG
jgi:hypothetical protein